MSRVAYRSVVLGLLLFAAIASAATVSDHGVAGIGARVCGVERWDVKTLRDPVGRKVNFTLRVASVRLLRRLPQPRSLGASRVRPVETTAVRIEALLIGMKIEEDQDIHLIVRQPEGDPRETMIVELPAATCTAGASPARRRQMRRARANLIAACGTPGASRFQLLRGRATITGVAFFDQLHGQTGVAPNGVELHPVLSIKISRC